MTHLKRPPTGIDTRWTGCSVNHLEPVDIQLACKWCDENIDDLRLFWRKIGYEFWFFEPKWATLFRLKWGG
jgi:hypothetical protein